MKQVHRRQLLMTVTALVWAAALAASTGRIRMAAKAPVLVALSTQPGIVHITLNGEKLFEGNYVQTPLKLSLPPGQNVLRISRDGYIGHKMTVTGSAGETYKMDGIILQRNPELPFASLEVTTSDRTPALTVELDDGLAHGETPFTNDELTIGAEHSLVVFPKWPEREPRYRCKFTPQGEAEGAEHKIRISLGKNGSGFKTTNCTNAPKRPKK